MRKFPIYRYIRPDGGVSISPVKPDTEYTERTRLVADEGCTITDGVTVTTCVDTDEPDRWTEIADADETAAKAAAYDILIGEVE